MEKKGFFTVADVVEEKKMIRDAINSFYYSLDLTDVEKTEEIVYKPDMLKNIMGEDWDYKKDVDCPDIKYPVLPSFDESIDSLTITQCVNNKTGEGFLLEGVVNEDGSKENLYIIGLIGKDTTGKLASFLEEIPLHEIGFKVMGKDLEKLFNEKEIREVADLTPDSNVNKKIKAKGRT